MCPNPGTNGRDTKSVFLVYKSSLIFKELLPWWKLKSPTHTQLMIKCKERMLRMKIVAVVKMNLILP